MGTRGPLPDLKLMSVADPAGPAPDATTMAERTKAKRPEKPPHMPAAASRMWDQIVDELEEAGLIAAFDAPTLDLALRHYALAVKASNSVMRAAVVQHDKKNNRTMKHPAATVFAQHSAAFIEYSKLLGLNFSARARLPIAEMGADNDSPFGGARS